MPCVSFPLEVNYFYFSLGENISIIQKLKNLINLILFLVNMSFEKLTREQLGNAIEIYEDMTADAGWHHRLCEDCGEVTNCFLVCGICRKTTCEVCNSFKLIENGKGKSCEKCLASKK
jgi:hypothetical protein